MLSKKVAAEKLDRYEELKAWEKALKAEMSAIEDDFKRELDRKGVDTLEVGERKVRYISVLSNRFDTTAFKREHNDLYKLFTKQVENRRFSVS